MTGPIGRVDPVSLRGLRRSLRRNEQQRQLTRDSSDLLVDVLTGAARLPTGRTRPAAAPGRGRRCDAAATAGR